MCVRQKEREGASCTLGRQNSSTFSPATVFLSLNSRAKNNVKYANVGGIKLAALFCLHNQVFLSKTVTFDVYLRLAYNIVAFRMKLHKIVVSFIPYHDCIIAFPYYCLCYHSFPLLLPVHIYLSFYLPTYLPFYLSIYLSIHLSIYLPIYCGSEIMSLDKVLAKYS